MSRWEKFQLAKCILALLCWACMICSAAVWGIKAGAVVAFAMILTNIFNVVADAEREELEDDEDEDEDDDLQDLIDRLEDDGK